MSNQCHYLLSKLPVCGEGLRKPHTTLILLSRVLCRGWVGGKRLKKGLAERLGCLGGKSQTSFSVFHKTYQGRVNPKNSGTAVLRLNTFPLFIGNIITASFTEFSQAGVLDTPRPLSKVTQLVMEDPEFGHLPLRSPTQVAVKDLVNQVRVFAVYAVDRAVEDKMTRERPSPPGT